MVAGEDGADKIFNVVDAFDVPRFSYVAERKKYLPDSELGKPEPSLYAGKKREGRNRFCAPEKKNQEEESARF